MSVRSIAEKLPAVLSTPAHYWYRALRGRLDRELRLLRVLVRPGSIAVDVGGNAGVYTYGLARLARVEVFEPLPVCLRALRAFAARHKNVRVHEVALSRAPGKACLRVPYVNGRLEAQRATLGEMSEPHECCWIAVRTLDSYELRDVSLIKIDVEGHEGAVLEGASATIARERPALLVEIEQRHLDVPMQSAFDRIEALGYAGVFVAPSGQVLPLAEFRFETYQEPYLEVVARGYASEYVNNFLFLPRDDPRSRMLGVSRS